MIKTLRSNNSSFANLASIQVQPQPIETVAFQAQKQTSTLQNPNSLGPVTLRQAILPISTITLKGGVATLRPNNSIGDITTAVSSGIKSGTLLIPIKFGAGHIMPTYSLNLDAGKMYDPRLTQGYVTTTAKFKPYETLTGISQERPQIIMLTNFLPLFEKDTHAAGPQYIGIVEDSTVPQFITDAGSYLDTQCQMRNLQTFNVQSLLKSLTAQFTDVQQATVQRQSDFAQALNLLQADVGFLLNLIRIVNSQKMQLDLRHDLYIVDPQQIATQQAQNSNQIRSPMSPITSTGLVNQTVTIGNKPSWSPVDAMTDLGYAADAVNNVFSSTKIWMQLLVELKSILKYHSLQFIDIDPLYQRLDTNASTIMLSPVKLFSLAQNPPSLPVLDDLGTMDVLEVPTTANEIQTAFANLYQNVYFKNEEARLAALANLLTKEFKYSYGLAQTQVQKALSVYGFTAAPEGNSTLFDSILGSFGNNITDFPPVQAQSLAGVAQINDGQVGVLTFESSYVEGDTGTLTPGGDFYFDRLFATSGASFDTSAIDQLSTTLTDQLNQLNTVIDAFNLFSIPVSSGGASKTHSPISTQASSLGDALSTITQLGGQLINTQSGEALTPVINDRLCSVFALARTNNTLKSQLFLYTVNKVMRSYGANLQNTVTAQKSDNTPLTDYLITQITSTLAAAVPESRAVSQLLTQRGLDNGINTDALTDTSVSSALKNGTVVTQIVVQFMTSVLTQFRSSSTAIQNHFTRYSGYLDTIVMMVAFDFVVSMIARYSNQSIVGSHSGLATFSQGQHTYVISQATTNHTTSFNELTQRCTAESQLTQELLMTILNVLQNLGGSLKGISNYLNSAAAKATLSDIAATLQNDPNMIRMLFSQQQIMLLASTVNSLVTANALGNVGVQPPQNQQIPSAGSATAQAQSGQEITILDESDVSPALKSAIMGFFGTGDFATASAANKRLITVGIPLGFVDRIKQVVSIQQQKRASFQSKQTDIVSVTVYKVDLTNPDIVFKPQRFLFELARFPVRFTTANWLPLPQQPSLQDVVNAIPTQCYTQDPDTGANAASITSGIEYASSVVAGNAGVQNVRVAFDDPTYSFLTAAQKSEILYNHVTSQIVEAYVKLMTGINVSEYNYEMVQAPPPIENSFITSLLNHTIKSISNTATAQGILQSTARPTLSGGVLFSTTAQRSVVPLKSVVSGKGISTPVLSNPAGIAGNVSRAAQFIGAQPANPSAKSLEQQQALGTVSSNLDTLRPSNATAVSSGLRNISGLGNTWSSIANAEALNQRVLTPKQFDRVFNIIIDPNVFVVDVPQTIATPYGKTALGLLIQNGQAIPVGPGYLAPSPSQLVSAVPTVGIRPFVQGRADPNVNQYELIDQDVTQGDLITDKYFVTIETFTEGAT